MCLRDAGALLIPQTSSQLQRKEEKGPGADRGEADDAEEGVDDEELYSISVRLRKSRVCYELLRNVFDYKPEDFDWQEVRLAHIAPPPPHSSLTPLTSPLKALRRRRPDGVRRHGPPRQHQDGERSDGRREEEVSDIKVQHQYFSTYGALLTSSIDNFSSQRGRGEAEGAAHLREELRWHVRGGAPPRARGRRRGRGRGG